jgi:glycosyltransferase involved in cell wall biosynthesis
VITSIESCRGLPADVVEMVALDAPPTEIAAKIRSVLEDPAHADAMRRAGTAFATEWTFERVAREIADVVRQTLAR